MVTCAAAALVEFVEHILLGFNIVFNLRHTPQDTIASRQDSHLVSGGVGELGACSPVAAYRHAGQCQNVGGYYALKSKCAGNESVVA